MRLYRRHAEMPLAPGEIRAVIGFLPDGNLVVYPDAPTSPYEMEQLKAGLEKIAGRAESHESHVEAVTAADLEDGDVILSDGQRALIKMIRGSIHVCRGSMAGPLTSDTVLRVAKTEVAA